MKPKPIAVETRRHDWTQAVLAKRSGVSRAWLARFETGHPARLSAISAKPLRSSDPEFDYDPGYIDQGHTPLSVQMPIVATTYRGLRVQAFLEGLLPEDTQTRQRWAAQPCTHGPNGLT